MLSLDNVQVSIEGVRVLRNVSCRIEERKTTVLIGRNGAGKTTTLRAIMGLLPLDGGAIRLDDDDLVKSPAHHRAQAGIGYAPEDRRLVAELSVEENIRLPALALKLNKIETKRRLDEVYALLPQLHTMRERPGGGVSGGQGKMVALGRALMVARKVLLLDEPFQGLRRRLRWITRGRSANCASTAPNLHCSSPNQAPRCSTRSPTVHCKSNAVRFSPNRPRYKETRCF